MTENDTERAQCEHTTEQDEAREPITSEEFSRLDYGHDQRNYVNTVCWGEWPGYDATDWETVTIRLDSLKSLLHAIEEIGVLNETQPIRLSLPTMDGNTARAEGETAVVAEVAGRDEVAFAAGWLGDFDDRQDVPDDDLREEEKTEYECQDCGETWISYDSHNPWGCSICGSSDLAVTTYNDVTEGDEVEA